MEPKLQPETVIFEICSLDLLTSWRIHPYYPDANQTALGTIPKQLPKPYQTKFYAYPGHHGTTRIKL